VFEEGMRDHEGAPRELMNALIYDRIFRRLLRLSATAAGVFTLWTSVADAEQEQRTTALQVASGDLAAANALTKQIAALSPRVRTEEAARLAECAYVTVSQLRRQYRMFGTPIFNNFLIYHASGNAATVSNGRRTCSSRSMH
jgi:hypothetical protein